MAPNDRFPGFKTTYREAVLNEQGEVIGHRGWINPSPLPPFDKVNLNESWLEAALNPSPEMLEESSLFLTHEIGCVEEVRNGIRRRKFLPVKTEGQEYEVRWNPPLIDPEVARAKNEWMRQLMDNLSLASVQPPKK